MVSGVGDGVSDGGADGYACAEHCALFMDTWIRFDAMLSCTSEPLLCLFCFDLFFLKNFLFFTTKQTNNGIKVAGNVLLFKILIYKKWRIFSIIQNNCVNAEKFQNQ